MQETQALVYQQEALLILGLDCQIVEKFHEIRKIRRTQKGSGYHFWTAWIYT